MGEYSKLNAMIDVRKDLIKQLSETLENEHIDHIEKQSKGLLEQILTLNKRIKIEEDFIVSSRIIKNKDELTHMKINYLAACKELDKKILSTPSACLLKLERTFNIE